MAQLKGLWISDMVVPTGFSRVTHSILKYLLPTDNFDIVGLGVNYRGDPHPYTFMIYPAILGGDVYGLGRIKQLVEAYNFDFIFILNDTWIINKYLEELKKLPKEVKLPKIIVYFPVDSEEHDVEWYKNFDIVSEVVTYTEFGRRVINKLMPEMKVHVIPHGVDTSVFFKAFENRQLARAALFGGAKKDLLDAFIVLNANRNQPRKRLDVTIKGFSEFIKDKPKENIRLYMHSGVRDSSIDIPKITERYHVNNRLIVTNLNPGIQVVPDNKLNVIYNSCDVGINTSMGEGWGLTSIEHAVTGAPQIIPNHSACTEIFSDGCGIFVEPVAEFTFDHTATVGKLVDAAGVANALQKLWDDKHLYNEVAEKAFTRFTGIEYNWQTIAKQWSELILGLK